VALIGLLAVCRSRATFSWGPGSVLVELSVVEQRPRAVQAVLVGESVTSVATQVGFSIVALPTDPQVGAGAVARRPRCHRAWARRRALPGGKRIE